MLRRVFVQFHVFCSSCAMSWGKGNKSRSGSKTCPNCRTPTSSLIITLSDSQAENERARKEVRADTEVKLIDVPDFFSFLFAVLI